MNHPGKKIYTKKEDIKNVYGRNNARNRDVYSIAKATGRTVDLPYELLPSQHTDAEIDYNFEDDLIEQIDASREDPEDSV